MAFRGHFTGFLAQIWRQFCSIFLSLTGVLLMFSMQFRHISTLRLSYFTFFFLISLVFHWFFGDNFTASSRHFPVFLLCFVVASTVSTWSANCFLAWILWQNSTFFLCFVGILATFSCSLHCTPTPFLSDFWWFVCTLVTIQTSATGNGVQRGTFVPAVQHRAPWISLEYATFGRYFVRLFEPCAPFCVWSMCSDYNL